MDEQRPGPPQPPASPLPFAPAPSPTVRRAAAPRLVPVELATYAVVVATAVALVLYFAMRG